MLHLAQQLQTRLHSAEFVRVHGRLSPAIWFCTSEVNGIWQSIKNWRVTLISVIILRDDILLLIYYLEGLSNFRDFHMALSYYHSFYSVDQCETLPNHKVWQFWLYFQKSRQQQCESVDPMDPLWRGPGPGIHSCLDPRSSSSDRGTDGSLGAWVSVSAHSPYSIALERSSYLSVYNYLSKWP